MHEHLPKLKGAAVLHRSCNAQIRRGFDVLVREPDFLLPRAPRLIDDVGVGDRTVEVRVPVALGTEQHRRALPGHDIPEPVALDLG